MRQSRNQELIMKRISRKKAQNAQKQPAVVLRFFAPFCGLTTWAAILVMAMAPDLFSITLTEAGKTSCVIAVAEDAIEPEKTAARELQSFLKQVTGADFPIVTENTAKPEARLISVGQTARFKKTFPDINLAALKADGIVMKTSGENLYLAGGRPRGTLYAVYTFLEDVVGVRWWTSKESFIPSQPGLVIGNLNTVQAPPMSYRELHYFDMLRDPLFAARCKNNGFNNHIDDEYGGHFVTPIQTSHTFYMFFPPAKYFQQHPGWYSEVNGKRVHEDVPGGRPAQLCLTNPELLAETIRVVKDYIRQEPRTTLISISHNDGNWGWCGCDPCKAVEDEEEAKSGALLRFVNAVAAEVEKEFPRVLIHTLAYGVTVKPPLLAKARGNVVVQLCTDGQLEVYEPMARFLPVTASENFMTCLETWNRIAPNRLFIWDYATDFSNYILPFPSLAATGKNIRVFSQNGVMGGFIQGDAGSYVGDFPELKTWVHAHLLWDPSRDPDKLASDFLRGYYGGAAQALQEYLDLTRRAGEQTPASGFSSVITEWLSLDDINRATLLFDRAEAAVKKDPMLAARVRRARLSLDHAWLLGYHIYKMAAGENRKEFKGPADPVAACNEFIARCRACNVRRISEGGLFDQYESRLRQIFNRSKVPLPPEFKGQEARSVDFQEDLFTGYTFAPGIAEIVNDPSASNGKAVWMKGNSTGWWVQLMGLFPQFGVVGEWHAYAVIRCEVKPGAASGNAFSAGIHDLKTNRSIMTITGEAQDMADGKYHVIDFGGRTIDSGCEFWVAPCNNPNVAAVYVDRLFFIKGQVK